MRRMTLVLFLMLPAVIVLLDCGGEDDDYYGPTGPAASAWDQAPAEQATKAVPEVGITAGFHAVPATNEPL